MPNSTKEEKFRWIKPILDGEITIKNMILVSPFSKRALQYWLKAFKQYGLTGLENKSTRPYTHPNETPIRIKEAVIDLRKDLKKCALKLKSDLKHHGMHLGIRTIGKILKQEGLTRRYRSRKVSLKRTKINPNPGELVEIDIKWVPSRINGYRWYQFTAIDCASRWRYLDVYSNQGNTSSINFLKTLITVAPFKIQAIKTDNGSCFTNRYTGYLKSSDPLNPRLHIFDIICNQLGIAHYLIDPGKPAQNGRVERSHRSDQETFYDQVSFGDEEELRLKLKLWNMYYNDLEHCALNGKSPNQYLGLSKVQNVRA